MNVTVYVENDWRCYTGFLVKKIAMREEWVHPEWGEIDVVGKNGNDISLVVDGHERVLRIVGCEDKRKYSYISYELIDPKDKKAFRIGNIKWPLDAVNAIRNL